MPESMQLISENYCFSGWHRQYKHNSSSTKTEMRFAIYLPPQASNNSPVPVMYWLSGLTANHENFMQKAAAQRVAAELGIAIVAADTSPRGTDIADDSAYDLGQGAGFYVNATQDPWQENYKMYDYIVDELPSLIEKNFPVTNARAISGHSMGGHGALVIALRNPHLFSSVSAFAPICHPVLAPWGKKAFKNYLGEKKMDWENYDACCLMSGLGAKDNFLPMRIDQGENDQWLKDQLHLDDFIKAASAVDYPLEVFRHKNYDHNYYFVASFIEQHLFFHAKYLLSDNTK